MAREREISVQAKRREGSLTPCYNADRYGTDITVIGDGQPQLYGFIKMLAGGMQMVAGPNGTAAAFGTKGIVARGLAPAGIVGRCPPAGAGVDRLEW